MGVFDCRISGVRMLFQHLDDPENERKAGYTIELVVDSSHKLYKFHVMIIVLLIDRCIVFLIVM